MKIRLLTILGLMFLCLMRPGRALADLYCTNGPDDYCEGVRVLDAPVGCKEGYGNYCVTDYNTNTAVDCDSECLYPVISQLYNWWTGYRDLLKCSASAVQPFCETSVEPTTVGPGSCCANDGPGGSPPPGGCGTSNPSGLGVNWGYSGSQMELTWTPGTGGDSQTVLVSDNSLAILNNCLGAYSALCFTPVQGLPVNRNYYRYDLDLFDFGTIYYFKVWNIASPLSCSRSATKISTYTAAACDAGVPTWLAADWDYSTTRMELSWTPGGGTDSTGQRILASSNQTALNNDCDGAYAGFCDINYTTTNPNLAFYRPLKTVFDSGTVYYFKILNVADPTSCNVGSDPLTTLSSCGPDPAAITGLEVGESRDLYASVVNNPVIFRINFTSNAPAIASVAPPYVSGSAPAYKTSVTGVSAGNTSVDIAVRIGTTTVCTSNAPVAVVNIPSAEAWWQVVDGNLHAESSL